MRPIENLKQEHRVIEGVLRCLEELARRGGAGEELDPQYAKDVIRFLREYADQRHHAKEETHLFPRLEERGIPSEGGPIGVMLEEHQMGRREIVAMAEAIEGAARGEQGSWQTFAHHADRYVGLLIDHIAKEDDCLFAMAEQALSVHDQDELQEIFADIDRKAAHDESADPMLRLAGDLTRRVNPPGATLP